MHPSAQQVAFYSKENHHPFKSSCLSFFLLPPFSSPSYWIPKSTPEAHVSGRSHFIHFDNIRQSIDWMHPRIIWISCNLSIKRSRLLPSRPAPRWLHAKSDGQATAQDEIVNYELFDKGKKWILSDILTANELQQPSPDKVFREVKLDGIFVFIPASYAILQNNRTKERSLYEIEELLKWWCWKGVSFQRTVS